MAVTLDHYIHNDNQRLWGLLRASGTVLHLRIEVCFIFPKENIYLQFAFGFTHFWNGRFNRITIDFQGNRIVGSRMKGPPPFHTTTRGGGGGRGRIFAVKVV